MRKSFNPEFMAKIALEAIKGEKTIVELSSNKYEVHRTQIVNWRKRSMEGIVDLFKGKQKRLHEENGNSGNTILNHPSSSLE